MNDFSTTEVWELCSCSVGSRFLGGEVSSSQKIHKLIEITLEALLPIFGNLWNGSGWFPSCHSCSFLAGLCFAIVICSKFGLEFMRRVGSMARMGLCPAFPRKHSELKRNLALKNGKFHPNGLPRQPHSEGSSSPKLRQASEVNIHTQQGWEASLKAVWAACL